MGYLCFAASSRSSLFIQLLSHGKFEYSPFSRSSGRRELKCARHSFLADYLVHLCSSHRQRSDCRSFHCGLNGPHDLVALATDVLPLFWQGSPLPFVHLELHFHSEASSG